MGCEKPEARRRRRVRPRRNLCVLAVEPSALAGSRKSFSCLAGMNTDDGCRGRLMESTRACCRPFYHWQRNSVSLGTCGAPNRIAADIILEACRRLQAAPLPRLRRRSCKRGEYADAAPPPILLAPH